MLEEALIGGATCRLGEAESVGEKSKCALFECFLYVLLIVLIRLDVSVRLASTLLRVNLLLSCAHSLSNVGSGAVLHTPCKNIKIECEREIDAPFPALESSALISKTSFWLLHSESMTGKQPERRALAAIPHFLLGFIELGTGAPYEGA